MEEKFITYFMGGFIFLSGWGGRKGGRKPSTNGGGNNKNGGYGPINGPGGILWNIST
ncbi:hypothetical protein [Fusobacterium polymorphum]|uniref:Uncharacterized protein n=1 Tax=Fusobacterium polymorphum ATCC 10953 TaxID=393480 RepID=A5TX04_FUSNP|nr:hypothetical protein [Fusobacterium polymorphum]EDK89429.1 hypothetical protein FNP_1653 [Fusobacterium polymorphum ATCC 10953]